MATDKQTEELRGTVLRIERSSVHDGDGFRTVVFLKGCPLCCQWCSTPESQSLQVEHIEDKTYGKIMTVEEVMKEIRKDSAFFFNSNGGMTLSGGEIVFQAEFAHALLETSWHELINTAIETSFYAPWKKISPILDYVNTAFVDMKFYDTDKHLKYCGVNNQLILKNLLETNHFKKAFRLIIRVPIIPGINDSRDELERIGVFCVKLKHLSHIQLLPYHRLGVDTYRKLGRPYALASLNPPTEAHMSQCREIVAAAGTTVI